MKLMLKAKVVNGFPLKEVALNP